MRSTILAVAIGSACFLAACQHGQHDDRGTGSPTSGGAGVSGDDLRARPLGPGVPVKVTMSSAGADGSPSVEGDEVVVTIELSYAVSTAPAARVVLFYSDETDWVDAPPEKQIDGPITNGKRVLTFKVRSVDRPGASDRQVGIAAVSAGVPPKFDSDWRPLKGKP